jgi:hypothetical protein
MINVLITETKLEFIFRELVRSLWGFQHVDWCYLDGKGFRRDFVRVVEMI